MTREEKETLIAQLLAVSGNTTKIIRKNLIESLPTVPEELLDKMLEILEEP